MAIGLASIKILLRTGSFLSLPALHRLGRCLGRCSYWARTRSYRIVERNITLCFPQCHAPQRASLVRACLEQTGCGITETAWLWQTPARALAAIGPIHGLEHFERARAAGRGVIIAAPHLGSWEALNLWLSANVPFTLLYKKPEQPGLAQWITQARTALGAEAVPAGAGGVRTLVKRLRQGRVIGILPDQRPRQGEGAHAPFFGQPALTMSLLGRLANSTGAAVVFAYALRLPEGQGFSIHFQPADAEVADPCADTALCALNRGIEACVRTAPEQYQWTYKRFSRYINDEEQVYRIRRRRKRAAAPPA